MPHYKILVIDYEPRGVAQLRDPLHAAGYLVSVAHDGIAGTKLFEEIKPDLTLVEAMLPKKHGFEVCRDIKKTPHGAKTPVVIVTSVYRGRKYRTQAFHSYNCDEFLEKPVSSSTLLSTVERLLRDRPVEASAPAAAPPAPPSTEPKPANAPRPKAETKSEPAAEESGVAAPAVESEAELEISERLDDLFGGSDSEPKASASAAPDGENILSFDPARGRAPAGSAETATVTGGPNAGAIGRGPVAAHAHLPEHDQGPMISSKPWPELRQRSSRPEPAPLRHGVRGRWLLLLTILVVAAASSAVFLVLHWPF